jgi:cytochrome c
MPDGTGLPPGNGTARAGQSVYATRCSLCHGATGIEGPNDRLVGRLPADSFPFGTDPGVRRTVGNYWPWATTLFDYIRRAMPFDSPGSLSDDDVYALTAWILAANRIIAEDSVMDATSLPRVIMPANGRFVPDDRKGGRIVR